MHRFLRGNGSFGGGGRESAEGERCAGDEGEQEMCVCVLENDTTRRGRFADVHLLCTIEVS